MFGSDSASFSSFSSFHCVQCPINDAMNDDGSGATGNVACDAYHT
jgi:hypothetical protein